MQRRVNAPGPLLDFLAEFHPDSSRSTLRQMLRDARVRVNGEVEKRGARSLEEGDFVDVGPKALGKFLPPEAQVLHEDSDLIVVVKASGLLTANRDREDEPTLQRLLNAYLKETSGGRVWLVQRLDREASGVLVLAKNEETGRALKDLFASHDIERRYVAIVEGRPVPSEGTFRSILRENERTLHVSSVRNPLEGKEAITHYRTLKSGSKYSMIEVTLETGRKHQIRVHFAESGHPIIGDKRYGAKTNPIGRLALHAFILGFVHPSTGRKLRFDVPVPGSFRSLNLSPE